MVADENLTINGNGFTMVGEGGIFTGSGVLATPLSLFFVQAMIIISLSRLLHFFLGKINQPRVVSEIIGGVCLGPSALGRIPGFLPTIFPDRSLANLSLVANLGLVLYLFMVALELEPATFFGNLKKSLILAGAGVVVPLLMGAACSWGLYEYLSIGGDSKMTVSFGSFALFIGTAMTITAFPVLARILTEKCMLTTQLGTMTISAAAIDDVLAWILLALVISMVNASNTMTSVYILLATIGFSLFLLVLVRPLLSRFWPENGGKTDDNDDAKIDPMTMAAIFIAVFFCSWVTEFIGVHSIFGAFLLGLTLPRKNNLAKKLTKTIEDVVLIAFLPLFFASSGLKTNIGLLNDGATWLWLIVTLLVACASKIFGCGVIGRIIGVAWRQAMGVGIMMNARGLVELIVLNIGYDLHIINSRVFLIMVIMALVTTLMTTPLLALVYKDDRDVGRPHDSISPQSHVPLRSVDARFSTYST